MQLYKNQEIWWRVLFNKIKTNKGLIKYFKNTSWLLGEKILRLFLGMFVTVWVARYLGPEQFGLFSYAQSFAAIFAIAATLGLTNILIRDIVKDGLSRDVLLGTAFFLKLIGSVLVLLALAVVLNISSNNQKTNFMILLFASATIFQSFNVIDFYFQSQVLSRYSVYANAVALSLSSMVKIWLILNGATLISFVYVVIFDSLVLAAGFVYFYNKVGLSIRLWRFSKDEAIRLLKDSWPLIFSGIVITIYMKIDQVMIQNMLSSEQVGQYSAAAKLSEAWYFIPIVIVSSLFPAIINAKKKSEKLYYLRLRRLYSLMIWAAILLALPITFFSNFVINVIYGEKYLYAGNVLMIHIWAAVFVFIGVASGKWLINENLQKYSMINTTIGAVVNILLNYVLIKKIGIEGAAWSTLISYFVASYLSLAIFNKTRINFINISKSLFFIRN